MGGPVTAEVSPYGRRPTPPIVELPGALLLTGSALQAAAQVFQIVAGQQQSRGWPISPVLLELSRAARRQASGAVVSAPTSDDGHAPADTASAQPSSEYVDQQAGGDVLNSQQASELLGVTSRSVVRMGKAAGGRRIGRTWVFDRATVELLAAERAS